MARNWMSGWRNVRQIISYRVNRRGLTVVMLFRKHYPIHTVQTISVKCVIPNCITTTNILFDR